MSSTRTCAAGARRVDELAVADVDAHVREGAAHGVEEHQVTGLEFVARCHRSAGRPRGLLVGAARQHQAEAVLEDVAREAAAVEALLSANCRRAVGHAQEVHRRQTRSDAVSRTRYAEFHRRSIEDRDAFWAEQAALIDWKTPFDQVCDYSNPPFAKWFVGGTTNLCHNAVDRHLADAADQNALIFVSTETDQERSTASANCTPRCSAWRPRCRAWA
jgi:hypothetical protein